MNWRRLRVLEVAPRFLPHLGGVEVHVAMVAPRLAALGWDVTVLATDPLGELPPFEARDGFNVQRVRASPPHADWYWAPDIYRVIHDGRWDVVHCHSYQTFVAPVAMFAAWRSGVPYLLTLHSGGHSSPIRRFIRPLQTLALRPLIRRAEAVIGVSEFEIDAFRAALRLARRRFELVPSGVEQGPPHQPSPRDDRPLVISLGRLERYKGHQRVLAAMPYVLQEISGARLRILGDGPYGTELRTMTARMGIEDRVEIGPVPFGAREDLKALLASASLVVSLSEYESQGIAVAEAIAAGRATLVSGTTALAEYVQRGWATGVGPRTEAAEIARLMIDLLRSPPTVTRAQGPTWDDCAARLSRLYRKSLGLQ
jgi:glycosyltransferase involved in cell wall biosynthesis